MRFRLDGERASERTRLRKELATFILSKSGRSRWRNLLPARPSAHLTTRARAFGAQGSSFKQWKVLPGQVIASLSTRSSRVQPAIKLASQPANQPVSQQVDGQWAAQLATVKFKRSEAKKEEEEEESCFYRATVAVATCCRQREADI